MLVKRGKTDAAHAEVISAATKLASILFAPANSMELQTGALPLKTHVQLVCLRRKCLR